MSNIFAPWVRYNNKRVPLVVGTGPIVGGYKNQHLWFTDKFEIQCVRDGVIHHFGDALPFDVDGRLVVSTNDVDYWDQAIPFTSLNMVAIQDAPVDFIDQGVGFTLAGHLATAINTVIIPGEEWFKEFEVPPPSFFLPIEDFFLDPQTSCFAIQFVFTLKADLATIPDFQTLLSYQDLADANNFRLRTLASVGGLSLIANSGGVFQSRLDWNAGGPLAGDTLDVRWTCKPAGSPEGEGLRGWLNQLDEQSNLIPTEVASPLTHLRYEDQYITLVALRINHTCDLTDTEIIDWPNYNPLPPNWSPMPDQFNYVTDLPDTFDVTPYVQSVNGPVVNYSLLAPPVGFTIDSVTGIITADGAAEGDYDLTINAENATGAPGSNGAVRWVIDDGEPPLWDPIPDQSTRENNLPTNLDVSGYVNSPTSAITGYSLVAPPAGFTINASGVITVAPGTAVAVHAIVVQATNASGSANSLPFNWEILEELLLPQWGAIPDQENFRDELPQSLPTAPHVTSNNGPLSGWSLSPITTGFSINALGEVVATPAASETVHTMAVTVSNDSGPATSPDFDWTVKVFRLPPQWGDGIPDRSDRINTLPLTYDVSAYVTTNDGPLVDWALDDDEPPVGHPSGLASDDFNSGTLDPRWTIYDPVGDCTIGATGTHAQLDLPAGESHESWGSVNEFARIRQTGIDASQPFEIISKCDSSFNSKFQMAGFMLEVDDNNWVRAEIYYEGNKYVIFLAETVAGSSSALDDSNLLPEPTPRYLRLRWDGVSQVILDWTDDPALGWFNQIDANLDVSLRNFTMVALHGGNSSEKVFTRVSYDSFEVIPALSTLTAPPGFTIDQAGVITADNTLTVADYPLTVFVTNNQGTESTEFNWTITEELLAPVWNTIPDQTDRQNVLPQSFEASLYVTSNDGQALFAWTLINAPAGFSINSSGRVTCSAGTAVAAHTMQARVSNNSGTSTSATFTWNVLEELLVPQWSTIPNQNDDEDTLPQALDVSPYVTSNSGALTGWTLVGTNNGFTINGSGVVTAQSGTAPGSYTVTVQVSNDTGSSQKAFNWTINSVAATEYFHEFNADLGAFSFQRLSDGSAPQSPAEEYQRAFVDANVPCYWGCEATQREGGVFLPGPDWAGLYLERPSTNYCFDSTDHYRDPPWTVFETTVVDSGDPNRMRRTTAGTAAIFQQVAVPSSGDHTYSLDQQQSSTAPGKEIYISLDNFTTTRAFNTAVNFVRAWKTQSTGTTVGASTGFGASTSERWYLSNSQVEQGKNWTSAIKTIGSNTATRAGTVAQCLPADMGLDPAAMRTNHCGQVKFYHMWDIIPGISVCHQMLIDSSNYIWIAFLATGELFAEFNVNGTNFGFVSTTVINPDLFDLIDVRYKLEPSGYTVWFNGEKMTGGAGGTWPAGDLEITPGGGLSADAGNVLFRMIRINSTALSDAAIEAWA